MEYKAEYLLYSDVAFLFLHNLLHDHHTLIQLFAFFNEAADVVVAFEIVHGSWDS